MSYTMVLMLLLVLLLIFFAPIRAWTFCRHIAVEKVHAGIASTPGEPDRPEATPDLAAGSRPQVRVLLIHGTFSPNANWTTPGSSFIQQVAARLNPCALERLLWSGDNSSGERIKAAQSAARWIAEQTAERIYIIGHSHGGYIAALAGSMAADPRVRVITMSTPFFNVVAQPVRTADNKIDGLNDSCRFVLVLGWMILAFIIPAALRAMGVHRTDGIFFVIPTFVIFYTLICFLFWKWIRPNLHELFRRMNFRAEQLAEFSRISLSPEQMTVCRAAGDEATGVLAVSHIACWILLRIQKAAAALTRYIRRLEFFISDSFMRTIPGAIVVGALSVMAMYFWSDPAAKRIVVPLVLVGLFSLFRLFSIIVEVLLAIPVWGLSLVLNLPFGLELAVKSLIIAISVEATPVGRWTTVLVHNINSSLAHSALYEQEEIFEELARMHRTWQTS